jgi:hypothetical protein
MESKASSSLKSSHRRHGNVLVDYTQRRKDISNKKHIEGDRSKEVSMKSKVVSHSDSKYLQFEISFSSISSSDYLSDEGAPGDDLIDFYFKIPSRESRRGMRDDSLSDLPRNNHVRGRKLKKKSILQSVIGLS